MATIALFIALGGTGYAALQLPAASVGAKHLKKNSVTAKKIKKGAVTGRSVKDGSLGRRDFALGQVPAGPKGDKGDTGDTGAPGSARAYTFVNQATCVVATGACPLDPAETKGFSSARRVGTGTYCIVPAAGTGINRNAAAVLASVEWNYTNDPEGNASALPMKVLDGCSSNEIEVRAERLNVSGGADSVVSNTVSFYLAVL